MAITEGTDAIALRSTPGLIPGIRFYRFETDIGGNNSAGTQAIPHNLGFINRRVLHVDVWYRGNSAEAASLPVVAVDASYIYANIPAGVATRTIWASIILSDSETINWHMA